MRSSHQTELEKVTREKAELERENAELKNNLIDVCVRACVPVGVFDYISGHLKAPLSILVIGETNTGKSTLVNNLVGEDVAKVGKKTESETSKITLYESRIRGVDVRIFDTPGLRGYKEEKPQHEEEEPQDSSEGELRDCKEGKHGLRTLSKLKPHFKKGTFSFIIFCFQSFRPRMTQDGIDIFKGYHKIGIPWDKTFIALTFADMAHMTIHGPNRVEAYEAKIQEWRDAITAVLIKEGVEERIAEDLKGRIFPTTYRQSKLPKNKQEWLTPLWLSILEHMKPEAVSLYLKLHHDAISTPDDPGPQQGGDIELQPVLNMGRSTQLLEEQSRETSPNTPTLQDTGIQTQDNPRSQQGEVESESLSFEKNHYENETSESSSDTSSEGEFERPHFDLRDPSLWARFHATIQRVHRRFIEQHPWGAIQQTFRRHSD